MGILSNPILSGNPRLLGLALVLSAIASPSSALDDPYHGIYFGTLSGCGKGGFAFFVDKRGPGGNPFIRLRYGERRDLFSTINISQRISGTLPPDGSFFENGKFTSTDVMGSLFNSLGEICGSYYGTKQSKIGVLFHAAGYYAGNLSGTVFTLSGGVWDRTSGEINAILAPGGEAVVFLTASGLTRSLSDLDAGRASMGNVIQATLADDTVIAGSLNLNTLKGSGTFSGHVVYCFSIFTCAGLEHSGTWSMSRVMAWLNRSPTAVDDRYSVMRYQRLMIAEADGVHANDSDPDGDPFTAMLESAPLHGTLDLNADGSFTYVPESTFVGDDTFSYRATDGLASSNPATVTITVQQFDLTPILQLLLDD